MPKWARWLFAKAVEYGWFGQQLDTVYDEQYKLLTLTYEERKRITDNIIDLIRLIGDWERVSPETHVIVMGYDQLDETLRDSIDRQYFSFSSSSIVRHENGCKQFMNFDIHAVPYFHGMIILPKKVFE